MANRALLGAGLVLGCCSILLNGCSDDENAVDPAGDGCVTGGARAQGGSNSGGSNSGGSNASGSNAGGSNAGGSNAGGSNASGTGGNPSAGGAQPGTAGSAGSSAGSTGESGAQGGEAAAGGKGGTPSTTGGQPGSSGGVGIAGMAGESGSSGASGSDGSGGTAGGNAGASGEAGLGGAGGDTGEPARTCADGCAELIFPVAAWGDGREWEVPLGTKVDLSTSVISVRLRVIEGTVGGIQLFAKNGAPNWGSKYVWNNLPAVGVWTTLTVDLTTSQNSLVVAEVESLGLRYDTGGMWATTLSTIRIDVDSISISNASVGPWNFTTSREPLVLGWTPTETPGSVSWLAPEN